MCVLVGGSIRIGIQFNIYISILICPLISQYVHIYLNLLIGIFDLKFS